MIPTRRALLAAFIVSGSAVQAKAGCFDWLCGKTTTPVLPYTVGFAPQTTITPLGPPVAIGPPMFSSPVGVVPASGFVQPGMVAPGVYSANFAPWNTPSALQMPAYGAIPQPINNPSVLTGMPVNPALGQAPVTVFRTNMNPGFAAPVGGFAVPQTSFNSAAAFQAPTQISPGVMAQPAFAPPPQASSGGLFGKVFGNNYQTNYNNVPTTVFRPVQQVDPTTGQTVIVQQPCMTNTQQVQRTPYTALQPAPTAQPYYGEPTCGNEPPRYQSPSQFAPTQQFAPAQQFAPTQQFAPSAQYAPSGQYPAQAGMTGPNGYSNSGGSVGSGVAQTGAQDLSYGAVGNNYNGYATPIPSTDPAPLQGYSSPQTVLPPVVNPNGSSYQNGSGNGSPNGYGQPSDQTRVEQPSLGASNWGSTNRESNQAPRSLPMTTPSTNVSSKYSDLPPIPAADDYSPPSWGNQPKSLAIPFDAESTRPITPTPAISPPSWNDRTAQRLAEPRDGEQSARYASQGLPRIPSPNVPPPQPIKRNDGGWFPISQ